jgi:pimeloyl-ACP methyl ester carboxylesterase
LYNSQQYIYGLETIKNSYSEGYVNVNGIKMHYIDWGGNKDALVLVHAWGESPYLFLDLANDLKVEFRVISYAARGHGNSETTDDGYEIENLTKDLKLLLDALAIDKTSLLGFSSVGNEITEFAIKYPEKTNKLIYLEGGYDLSHQLGSDALQGIPVSFIPDNSVLGSFESYREWIHGFWYAGEEWTELLENNLKAITRIKSDGTVEPVPHDDITGKILQSHLNYYREYNKIHVPVLAFFAATFLNTSSTDPTIVSAYEEWNKTKVQAWKQHSIARLQNEINNITIEEIPGTSHTSIIFKNKKHLLNSIIKFLNFR